MMKPYVDREKQLTICTSCIEVNKQSSNNCSNCGLELTFKNENNFLEINESIFFYAYQQRITLEKEIDRTNEKGPFRSYSHIPYSEIFAFIAGSVLSGMTWDATKYLLKKIHKSITDKNIVLDDERMTVSGATPDLDLLEKLVSDNSELEKMIQYLEDYSNKSPHNNAHVRQETKFIELPENYYEQTIVSDLGIAIQTKIEEEEDF